MKQKAVPAIVLALIFAVGLIPGVSYGAIAARGEKAQRAVDLEAVTVTAQKQEENVQEVPVSVTVLNEQDIEDRKIESVRDIADFVPNLMIFQHDSSGANTPTMRGMTAPSESFRVSTGLYVDGIPVTTSVGFEESIVDIERVEVLRGPQGTIYGKGAQAGVINVITRQPDNEFRGRVSGDAGLLISSEAGDPFKKSFALNLSGPILNDRLFAGIAGQYYQKDGYIENTATGDDVNDREHWSGRGHLRWTPSDDLDVSLILSRLQWDDGAPNMNLGRMGAAMYGLPGPQDRRYTPGFKAEDTSKTDAQSLKIGYSLSDFLTLTSVTTHRLHHQETKGDWDFSPAELMHGWKDSEYEATTQELRLDYSAQRLKWLVGVYADRNNSDVEYGTISMMPSMAGEYSRDIEGETYAAFANFTYPLSRRLNIVAGLRYEIEKMDFQDNKTGLKADDTWSEMTPKVALEFFFTPDIMGYAGASKGYRSGGFNALAVSSPNYISYDAETFWSYEAGLKSAFLNNRLIINGAVYYMDISDMQVAENLSPSEAYLTNAAEATAKGVELEVTARVYGGLSLMAGWGYNDIEFGEFSDALGDYKGNKNPYAPEYSVNIGAQYRHDSGFYARADLIGYGEIFFDKANQFSRDPFEIVNAKIGYETEHYDIYVYGKNIFDKRYDSDGYYGGFYTIYSDPGEAGLQVVYRF